MGGVVIFQPLSKEQYERLSPEQKLDYLLRLKADIQSKIENTKRAVDERDKRQGPSRP